MKRVAGRWILAGTSWLAASVMMAASAVVPFIEDDYDRAVAEARARQVPLFVEAWAPW